MKRFALPDTILDPYFTIDAGGAVIVKIASVASGRMSVEIWRDGKILCRVFAKSIQVAKESANESGDREDEGMT
jgi:hypothetical protein